MQPDLATQHEKISVLAGTLTATEKTVLEWEAPAIVGVTSSGLVLQVQLEL